MGPRKLAPIHPGEILMEEYLKPMGISQYRLAKDISVPPRRINEIVHGSRAISADTALRLARYFGTSEMFWYNLQANYDLAVAREELWAALQPGETYCVARESHFESAHIVAARPGECTLEDTLPGPE